MLYIEVLRELAKENGVKVRTDAKEASVIKKLKSLGVEVPPKPEDEDHKVNFADHIRRLNDLERIAREARNRKDAKGQPIPDPDLGIKEHRLRQAFESSQALFLKMNEEGDPDAPGYLISLLDWVRKHTPNGPSSGIVKINRGVEDLVNKLEWEVCEGRALCVKSPPMQFVSEGDELRFKHSFVNGNDLYTFFPIHTVSREAQTPPQLGEEIRLGYKPKLSDYPAPRKQYKRRELYASEFEKYFQILEDDD